MVNDFGLLNRPGAGYNVAIHDRTIGVDNSFLAHHSWWLLYRYKAWTTRLGRTKRFALGHCEQIIAGVALGTTLFFFRIKNNSKTNENWNKPLEGMVRRVHNMACKDRTIRMGWTAYMGHKVRKGTGDMVLVGKVHKILQEGMVHTFQKEDKVHNILQEGKVHTF
jgi:hypothetical protein